MIIGDIGMGLRLDGDGMDKIFWIDSVCYIQSLLNLNIMLIIV